jgi:hypothetical protein
MTAVRKGFMTEGLKTVRKWLFSEGSGCINFMPYRFLNHCAVA